MKQAQVGDSVIIMQGDVFRPAKISAVVDNDDGLFLETDIGVTLRDDDHISLQAGGGSKRPGTWDYVE